MKYYTAMRMNRFLSNNMDKFNGHSIEPKKIKEGIPPASL